MSNTLYEQVNALLKARLRLKMTGLMWRKMLLASTTPPNSKARADPFWGQSQRQNASADRLRRRARSGEIWLGVEGVEGGREE